MAGIKDIARLSGTSIATVSRALNKSGYVSAEVGARIEAAVRATGFQPNVSARRMRTQESRMIALVLPALDVPFFGILAHEVEQALFSRGYTAMICTTNENAEREADYVSALLAQRVDGVLVASVTPDSHAFRRIRDAGIPMVAIDRQLPDVTPHTVAADHRHGLDLAVGHLLSLGHRDFVVLGAPGHSWPIQERLAGALAALAAAGIAPLDVALGEEHTFEACRDLMDGIFLRGHRPTAVVCTTDVAAIGAIHSVGAHGLRVPQDVSITGFDDLPAARYVVPQLTTVAQPIRAVGRRAVADLLNLVAGIEPGDADAAEPLDLRLILRGTTQSPAGRAL